MRVSQLVSALLPCLLLAAAVRAAPPPLPAEHLTVRSLPPHNSALDLRVRRSLHQRDRLRACTYSTATATAGSGQIDAGFTPGFNLSPDGTTSVVATTYFARGSRGTRTDVVEFTDNATLAPRTRSCCRRSAR